MKNGSKWKITKGCFGGSLPSRTRTHTTHLRSYIFTASASLRGTAGSKLTRRLY